MFLMKRKRIWVSERARRKVKVLAAREDVSMEEYIDSLLFKIPTNK